VKVHGQGAWAWTLDYSVRILAARRMGRSGTP
jgi:hypothetical protein